MSEMIRIRHLDNPNITTFIDGKQINIRNHQALVDRQTAKAMMDGPYGYELIGVYDNFLEYVNKIPIDIQVISNQAAPDSQFTIIAVPLTGQKIYSWTRLTESFLALEGRENTHPVFVLDAPAESWKDEVIQWSKDHANDFHGITLIFWDADSVMAWNRVFKITVSRQFIFNYARTLEQASHLWFVDSDNIHKPDALQKLLSHKRDTAAGIYFFKSVISGGPVVFNGAGEKTHPPSCIGEQDRNAKPDIGIIESDWTGAGSLLLSRKIFIKYNFDWSKWIQRNGEDAWICMLAQEETGQKVLVDTSVHSVHLDESGKEW